jgi:hypothetical protein
MPQPRNGDGLRILLAERWQTVQLVGNNGTPYFLQGPLLPLASTSPPIRLLGEMPERPCPRLVLRRVETRSAFTEVED